MLSIHTFAVTQGAGYWLHWKKMKCSHLCR